MPIPKVIRSTCAVFYFTRGDSIEGPLDVGLRFRGDTIRHKEKKSFRISFNSIDSGTDLYGIEKMDLNAEVNDPSTDPLETGHGICSVTWVCRHQEAITYCSISTTTSTESI